MDALKHWQMQLVQEEWISNMAESPKTPAAAPMTAYSSDSPQNRYRGNRRPDRVEEEKQFDERVIHIDRVARVVSGGRRFRFRALVVIGDHKGKVAMGIAKGPDVTTAVSKAVEKAKKSFHQVVITNATIPHDSTAKVGGANILLKPASKGTGLIAGGTIRTVLEVAGINNVLSKSLGSSNKINVAYATLKALDALKHPDDWLHPPVKAKSPKVKSANKTSEQSAEPSNKALEDK